MLGPLPHNVTGASDPLSGGIKSKFILSKVVVLIFLTEKLLYKKVLLGHPFILSLICMSTVLFAVDGASMPGVCLNISSMGTLISTSLGVIATSILS